MMTPRYLPARLNTFSTMLLALLALTAQGCGGGGGNSGTPNADPTGYYIDTGTASLDDGMSGTIEIDDLQAMVSGTRIMMMSVKNKLLYDGMITTISGNNFTANFTIYTDGINPISATASGTITTNSSISGTLSGSGVGSGRFDLLSATALNTMAADITRVENGLGKVTWQALIGGGGLNKNLLSIVWE